MKKYYASPEFDVIQIVVNDKMLASSDLPESMVPDQYIDQYLDNDDFTMPQDW